MINIYTIAVNRPDFIEYQLRTFARFLKDDHQLIVINDGHDEGQGAIPDGSRKIGEMAARLHLPCRTVTRPRRDTANYGHARSIEFAYAHDITRDTDMAVLVDGDIFLARDFSIREYCAGHLIAAVPQIRGHVQYLWPGLVFLDMSRLPDRETLSFWPDVVDGVACDVGGHSYEYLEQHPDVKVKWMENSLPVMAGNGNLDTLPSDLREGYDEAFAVEVLARAFIHYRAGTNWDLKSDAYHARKTRFLVDALERLSSGESRLA